METNLWKMCNESNMKSFYGLHKEVDLNKQVFVARPLESGRYDLSDGHTVVLYLLIYTNKKQKYIQRPSYSDYLSILDNFVYPADNMSTWDNANCMILHLTCRKRLNLSTLPRKVQVGLLRSLQPSLFRPDLLWRLELVPSLLFLAQHFYILRNSCATL